MSFDSILAPLSAVLRNEIVATDALLKSLKPHKFKRTIDKRKLNCVSSDFSISYAILPLADNLTQQFGWYYLLDKAAKTWYRKTDYFVETLTEIAKTDAQSVEHIFNSINECTACRGKPKAACCGQGVMSLGCEDFNRARMFFQHLNELMSGGTRTAHTKYEGS